MALEAGRVQAEVGGGRYSGEQESDLRHGAASSSSSVPHSLDLGVAVLRHHGSSHDVIGTGRSPPHLCETPGGSDITVLTM